MARKRMIDPNIWQSEDFGTLTTLGKIVFIGLFSHADDEGRGRANPAYLRSILFPYEESMRPSDIEKVLAEISAKMSIIFYSRGENKYYSLTNWTKWQYIQKPQQSSLPPPPESLELQGVNKGTIQVQYQYDTDTIPVQPNRIEKNRIEKNIKEVEAERKNGIATQDGGLVMDPNISKVFKEFERCGFVLNPFMADEIKALITDFSGEWVIEATKRSTIRGRKTLGYIRGILEKWGAAGCMDEADNKKSKEESKGEYAYGEDAIKGFRTAFDL